MVPSLVLCITGQRLPRFVWRFNEKKGADAEISLNSDSMRHFICETFGIAVIDSGCTKNVRRAVWLKCYLDTLHKEDVKPAHTFASNTNFRFGNGE